MFVSGQETPGATLPPTFSPEFLPQAHSELWEDGSLGGARARLDHHLTGGWSW